MLALVGLPAIVSRRADRYQLVHLLVWLHLSLTSIRNAPIFALAAAPPLALLLDGLPLPFRDAWPQRARRSLWAPALAVGVLACSDRRQDWRLWRNPLAAIRPGDDQPSSLRVLVSFTSKTGAA